MQFLTEFLLIRGENVIFSSSSSDSTARELATLVTSTTTTLFPTTLVFSAKDTRRRCAVMTDHIITLICSVTPATATSPTPPIAPAVTDRAICGALTIFHETIIALNGKVPEEPTPADVELILLPAAAAAASELEPALTGAGALLPLLLPTFTPATTALPRKISQLIGYHLLPFADGPLEKPLGRCYPAVPIGGVVVRAGRVLWASMSPEVMHSVYRAIMCITHSMQAREQSLPMQPVVCEVWVPAPAPRFIYPAPAAPPIAPKHQPPQYTPCTLTVAFDTATLTASACLHCGPVDVPVATRVCTVLAALLETPPPPQLPAATSARNGLLRWSADGEQLVCEVVEALLAGAVTAAAEGVVGKKQVRAVGHQNDGFYVELVSK